MSKIISLAQVAKLVVLSLCLLLIVAFGLNNVHIDPNNYQNDSGKVINQTNLKMKSFEDFANDSKN